MNTTHGVPRSVVLSGMRGRSAKDNLPLWIRQSSGVEQWAAALNADWIGDAIPTRGELARYDLLIANLRVDRLSRLLALATSRPRSQKWVTLIEGDAMRLLDPRETLLRLLDASDLVITINQKTLRYFQSLTQTRCKNIGIPYPVELVRSLAVPYEARERSVLICPRSNRMPSTIVAEALGLPVRVFVKRLSRQFKNVPAMLRHASLAKDLFVKQYSKARPSHLVTLETSLEHFWKTAATW